MSHGNGSSQGKRQKKQLSNNEKIYEKRIRSGYGRYIVPGAIGTVVILLIPFIANIWISLHSWRGGRSKMKFIGLDNYVKLLGDEKFWTSFSNSLYMIVAMVIIPLLIGLILAAVLFDYIGREFGGKTSSFLRACYYLPQILPVGVAGILWNWILNSQTGAINRILAGLFGMHFPRKGLQAIHCHRLPYVKIFPHPSQLLTDTFLSQTMPVFPNP